MRNGPAVYAWLVVAGQAVQAVLAVADPIESAGLATLPPVDLVMEELVISSVADARPGLFACPEWSDYFVFDALFLQRNNATVNRPIVVSRTATSAPEILAGDLQSTIGGGARFLYGN